MNPFPHSVVDASVGPEQAVEDWRTIRAELAASGHELHAKSTLVAASKVDAVADGGAVVEALARATGAEVAALSSATGEGVAAVLGALRRLVAEADEGAADPGTGPGGGKDPAPPPSEG